MPCEDSQADLISISLCGISPAHSLIHITPLPLLSRSLPWVSEHKGPTWGCRVQKNTIAAAGVICISFFSSSDSPLPFTQCGRKTAALECSGMDYHLNIPPEDSRTRVIRTIKWESPWLHLTSKCKICTFCKCTASCLAGSIGRTHSTSIPGSAPLQQVP